MATAGADPLLLVLLLLVLVLLLLVLVLVLVFVLRPPKAVYAPRNERTNPYEILGLVSGSSKYTRSGSFVQVFSFHHKPLLPGNEQKPRARTRTIDE
jgi:vancomycin permeability regulator SanA